MLQKMHRNDSTFLRFWALNRRHKHVSLVRHEFPHLVFIVLNPRIEFPWWKSQLETLGEWNEGRERGFWILLVLAEIMRWICFE